MKEVWVVVVVSAMLRSSQATLSYTNVAIIKSGYTGLVIAIHPDIAEDQELIRSIKSTWTDASRDLYIATGNRAYFKQITILLPKTWNGSKYDTATGNENYDLADIVIAPTDESYGNEPYTIQYGECGTMGIRTYFTPTYLLDDEFVQNYGPRGKVVVHEWSHYRWGVFDETSDDYPFYWDDSTYSADYGPLPTTCPKGITGETLNTQSGYRQCGLSDIDVTTNSYPYYCVFFPDEIQRNLNTSLMAYQYLKNVVTFCRDEEDVESDEHNTHNTEAPNSQNRLCSMKSVWSVIKESPDFQNWDSSDLSNISQTIPQFDIVIPQEYFRFVLVLDTSGSMTSPCGTVTRLECLTTAAYQFITVTAPNNSYIGIVPFSASAYVLEPLTLLSSQNNRDDLADSLTRLTASGSTCIGCGITIAIEELEKGGNATAGGELIVITDGAENESPYVRDVAPDVLQKGVIVNTIFISTDANQDLKTLSEESGGQNYLATTQQDLQEIFSRVSFTDSTQDNTFQIHSESFDVSVGTAIDSSFYIDASVGLNTVFTFTWSNGNLPPHIIISSPPNCYYVNFDTSDASLCAEGNSSYSQSTSFKTIQFNIPGVAEVGKWIYTVQSNFDVGLVTCVVTSAPSSDPMESIIIQSGMGKTQISSGAATVYAKVSQGVNPILGAIVTATIAGPSGFSSTIELYDNGAGSDIHVNDGIYSRYFTEFSGSGRYSVEVFVKNGLPTPITGSKASSRANYYPGYISTDGKPKVNPNGAISQGGSGSNELQSNELGNFSRVVPSGSFDYSGTVDVTSANAPDVYPPGKVTDAQLKQNDLENIAKGITLRFTAPGDDYDSGNASGYEIRYAFSNFTQLVSNFYNCTLLRQSDVTTGNLSAPLPAGSQEQFTIQHLDLPKDGNGDPLPYSYLGIAIVAFDETPNYADPSNVPILNIFIDPIKFPNPPEQQDVWWIIFLFIIVLIAIVVVWYKCRRTRPRKTTRRDPERQQHIATVIGNKNVEPSNEPTTKGDFTTHATSREQSRHIYSNTNEGPPPPPRAPIPRPRPEIPEYANIQYGYNVPIPMPYPQQDRGPSNRDGQSFDLSRIPKDEYDEIGYVSHSRPPPANSRRYTGRYHETLPAGNQSQDDLQNSLMNELKSRGNVHASYR